MVDDFLRRMQDALLGDENTEYDQNRDRRVRPASEDPYGDPADDINYGNDPFRNIRPASEDPYGDPADEQYSRRDRRVRPASEDPYGDPADQGLF